MVAVDEGLHERLVVAVEQRLDPRRERLHDLLVDAAHQPKVEEDEAAVVGEHHVALVRVGVHEPRHDERRRHRLAVL